MKKIIVLSFMALAFIVSSCSENIVDPQATGKMAKSGTNYTNSQIDSESEGVPDPQEGNNGWSETITLENGAIVVFVYNRSGQLTEVTGKTGPFDYELKVGLEYIKYSHARAVAESAVKGDIVEWYFSVGSMSSQESEVPGSYFRFGLVDEKYSDVYINASTGRIIKVNSKDLSATK